MQSDIICHVKRFYVKLFLNIFLWKIIQVIDMTERVTAVAC